MLDILSSWLHQMSVVEPQPLKIDFSKGHSIIFNFPEKKKKGKRILI